MDDKGIFIAGSDMNAGKTTFSLGLISWLEETLSLSVSFMKPLGQKTLLNDGESVGEDTFLVNSSMGLDMPLEYTAPFTMSSGMAQQYLTEGSPSDLRSRISRAFKYLRSHSDLVVVEGTGHPGVGSVFDLCNARVAGLLNIPVLLVLDGGIGRTIDRFTLCSSLFREKDIPILGVIINRVLEGKVDKVRKYLDPWFADRGVPVFGYIPYVNSLTEPSIGMLGRELGFRTPENGEDDDARSIGGFIAGFGSTGEILEDVARKPRSALLLSSRRAEVMDAILARRLSGSLSRGPGALVLCGGPPEENDQLAEGCGRLGIPLYRTSRTAGATMSVLNRRVFKVEPGESVKIKEIVRTVKNHVDLQSLLESLTTHDRPTGRTGAKPISRLRSWLSRVIGRG